MRAGVLRASVPSTDASNDPAFDLGTLWLCAVVQEHAADEPSFGAIRSDLITIQFNHRCPPMFSMLGLFCLRVYNAKQLRYLIGRKCIVWQS
jgi:hypothetical protein